jgi:hypothetical protein
MFILLLPSLNSVWVNFLLDAVPTTLLKMFPDILDLFVDEINISLYYISLAFLITLLNTLQYRKLYTLIFEQFVVLLIMYRNFLYLQDILIPNVIQWLLDTLLVTYCVGKQLKKVFRNKLKLVLTSMCLIILSQNLFFGFSVQFDPADFVVNHFLTSLKLPVGQSKIVYTQRYWASWSESLLNKKIFGMIYATVINKDIIHSWAGDFGHPSWKVSCVKQVIRLQK